MMKYANLYIALSLLLSSMSQVGGRKEHPGLKYAEVANGCNKLNLYVKVRDVEKAKVDADTDISFASVPLYRKKADAKSRKLMEVDSESSKLETSSWFEDTILEEERERSSKITRDLKGGMKSDDKKKKRDKKRKDKARAIGKLVAWKADMANSSYVEFGVLAFNKNTAITYTAPSNAKLVPITGSTGKICQGTGYMTPTVGKKTVDFEVYVCSFC